jgi:hypothetical protein
MLLIISVENVELSKGGKKRGVTITRVESGEMFVGRD